MVATSARVSGWGKEILPPQVFEARLVIEPELAALAARKRYPEDIVALHRALEELEREFAETSAYHSDLPVHYAIGRAARSPILEQAMEHALEHTRDSLWVDLRRRVLADDYRAREEHVRQTRQVVE